jgi:uracil-DNA glycosylase
MFLREKGVNVKGFQFHHAAFYELPEPSPALAASYHPSRQNTQTGKLTEAMIDTVFLQIRRFLDSQPLGNA